MRLSELWPMYEADKRLLGYSPYTLKAYRIQAKLLINYLGDVDIDDVTVFHLKQYLIEISDPERRKHVDKKPLKPSSIGHRVRFLKSFFGWIRDEGITEQNLARKIREPKMGKRVPKPLPETDLENLRLCCETPIEHALMEILFETGCRIGEIHRLNRSDIDWNTSSIIVLGKGDKERECYFKPRAAILLKRYLGTRDDDLDALFVTERKYGKARKPRRLSIARLRSILKNIAARAEIKTSVYPHRLRHSYACHLLENGAPMELIQTLLGHQKAETTALYASLSGPRRREMYRRYF